MNQEIMYSAFVDELTKLGSISEEQAEAILKEAGLGSALKGLVGAGRKGWQTAAKMSPAEVAAMKGGKLTKSLQSLAPSGPGVASRVRGMELGSRLAPSGGVGRGSMV